MHRAPHAGIDEAFRHSTRGHIVDLLRCRAMTADELSAEVGLTDKAVRAQLVALEREGLVRRRGRSRSGKAGKPAVIYEFDPAAEGMFCAGYAPMLVAALDLLAREESPQKRTKELRRIGAELAKGLHKPRMRTLDDRLKYATGLLTSWGGVPQAEQVDGAIVIRSCGCPVSAAVRAHPETCLILESMLSDLLEVPVRQHCDRAGNPGCRFEVRIPKSRSTRA